MGVGSGCRAGSHMKGRDWDQGSQKNRKRQEIRKKGRAVSYFSLVCFRVGSQSYTCSPGHSRSRNFRESSAEWAFFLNSSVFLGVQQVRASRFAYLLCWCSDWRTWSCRLWTPEAFCVYFCLSSFFFLSKESPFAWFTTPLKGKQRRARRSWGISVWQEDSACEAVFALMWAYK